ncbi:hypothetical protein A6R68_03479 [Neotoma lepida]|uniref:Uncharacterized protein n=1 Tax=Neotoma lepida TaxID=56216 RepID=A0A1A6GQM2_NEOLE|nr:hypothetical protein A6R68_03479 [Neotoma lepida]
MSSRLSLGH